jgi:thioredoxin 1
VLALPETLSSVKVKVIILWRCNIAPFKENPMANLKSVTNENFEQEVINSTTPVLVDFWAEWCGPCRALGPVLEEVAAENTGKVQIVKVNVDEAPELANRFGIRGIPTMILFKGGEVKSTLMGNQPKAEIVKQINSLA